MATPALQPNLQISKAERAATLALVLSIAILPFFLASLMTWQTGTPQSQHGAYSGYWFGLLQQVNGLALLAYVVYKRDGLQSLRPVLNASTAGRSLTLAFYGYLAYAVVAHIISSVHLFWTSRPASFSSTEQILPHGVSVVLVLYILCSPIFEELIVRWFLTEEMAALGLNVMLAAVMTATLQASYHLYQGTWNAVAALPLFLVFAVYYANTRRIWEIVLAHLWIDLMALAVHAVR